MKLVSFSSVLALMLGFGFSWASAMPSMVNPNALVGGFCIANNKCNSQFQANCLGKNCPANTTHEECSGGDENATKKCTTNGDCNKTAGCDQHGDCTCS